MLGGGRGGSRGLGSQEGGKARHITGGFWEEVTYEWIFVYSEGSSQKTWQESCYRWGQRKLNRVPGKEVKAGRNLDFVGKCGSNKTMPL